MSSKSNKLSFTQFLVFLWGATLAPVAESLISTTTKVAGQGGFLSPLFAFPLLLIWGYLLSRLCHRDCGLAQGIQEIMGSFLGKVLLICYLFWGVFLLTIRLRVCVEGFLSVGYQEGSLLFLLPLLALFLLWMSGSSLGGFARSSTLYFGVLLLVFLGILLLALPEANTTGIFPLWLPEFQGGLAGVLPVLGIFGYQIFPCFFLGEVIFPVPPGKHGKNWAFWSLVACVLCSLLIFVAQGTFGVALIGELSQVFYQLSKGIGVDGAFQRIESLISALWTLAEFILIGLLLRGSTLCLQEIVGRRDLPGFSLVIVVISTVIALIYPEIHRNHQELSLWGNLLFAWGIPLFLLLLKSLKTALQRRQPKGIPQGEK